jgi:hypothetical protein
MYIQAYSYVKMTVQNITEANDSTSSNPMDKQRIDANPVRGKTYHFSNPPP